MTLTEWSKSEMEYGRRVLDSGLEGARSGREAFFEGKSPAPFLTQSVRNAIGPAALGACIGVLSSCPKHERRSAGRAVAFGLVGGVLGLAAGLLWESRELVASIAAGALQNIGRARDEHWFERHPIDYA